MAAVDGDAMFGRRVGDEWGAASQSVLVAVYDAESAGRLAKLFGEAGILPTLAFSCAHLLSEVDRDAYGLIVLDTRFPCDHGSECARSVCAAASVPIIAVGPPARDEESACDLNLDAERDMEEIVNRGGTLLQLSRPVRLPSPLRWGPLELDLARHHATWRGRDLHLSVLQFRIMEVLVLAGGAVVTNEEITRRVWGNASDDDRERLVSQVRRIRRLIEDDPSNPQFLVRVRGRGFRLDAVASE